MVISNAFSSIIDKKYYNFLYRMSELIVEVSWFEGLDLNLFTFSLHFTIFSILKIEKSPKKIATHTHTHARTHARTHTSPHTQTHTRPHTHTHTHTHKYTHTRHTRTHTHTHDLKDLQDRVTRIRRTKAGELLLEMDKSNVVTPELQILVSSTLAGSAIVQALFHK